jgi:hypothetical protein
MEVEDISDYTNPLLMFRATQITPTHTQVEEAKVVSASFNDRCSHHSPASVLVLMMVMVGGRKEMDTSLKKFPAKSFLSGMMREISGPPFIDLRF